MSPRPAHVLVATGAAVLALGLATPSAALASHDAGNGPGRAGGSPSAEQRQGGDKDGDKGDKKDGTDAAKGGDKGDPAGNNGTIKIQPYGGVAGHANSPHPGCDFRLQMWNFDSDQTGTITFVGQAPTKGAVTKQPLGGTQLLSDDAASGGKDKDAFYDVRGASLGLTGTPAAKGFHVKVLVNADDAPGGAKSKVFWLDCPAAVAPAATSGASTGAAIGSTASAAGSVVQGTTAGAATTAVTTAGAVSGRSSQAARVLAMETTAAAFTGGAGAAAVGAAPAAQERGGALAFTGIPALALVLLGLSALVAGALAVWAGRRRTAAL